MPFCWMPVSTIRDVYSGRARSQFACKKRRARVTNSHPAFLLSFPSMRNIQFYTLLITYVFLLMIPYEASYCTYKNCRKYSKSIDKNRLFLLLRIRYPFCQAAQLSVTNIFYVPRTHPISHVCSDMNLILAPLK